LVLKPKHQKKRSYQKTKLLPTDLVLIDKDVVPISLP
jgi:hypothetical protein